MKTHLISLNAKRKLCVLYDYRKRGYYAGQLHDDDEDEQHFGRKGFS